MEYVSLSTSTFICEGDNLEEPGRGPGGRRRGWMEQAKRKRVGICNGAVYNSHIVDDEGDF